MQIRIFGRDPMLWVQALSAIIGVVVTLNVNGLSVTQAAAIVGVLTAGASLIGALAVRPFSIGAVQAVISALAVAFAAYGLNWPPETLGAVQLAVGPLLTLFLRQMTTPNHDPLPLPGETNSTAAHRLH